MEENPFNIRVGYALTTLKNKIHDMDFNIIQLESDIKALKKYMELLEDLIIHEKPSDCKGAMPKLRG